MVVEKYIPEDVRRYGFAALLAVDAAVKAVYGVYSGDISYLRLARHEALVSAGMIGSRNYGERFRNKMNSIISIKNRRRAAKIQKAEGLELLIGPEMTESFE